MIKAVRILNLDPQDEEVAQAAEIISRELKALGIETKNDATSTLEFSSRSLRDGFVVWKSQDFEKNLPVESCANVLAELK